MSRESALFYLIAIPLGVAGTAVAKLLGWGDTAVFVTGMGPGFVVMFIFMLRERNYQLQLDHRVKPQWRKSS